MFTQFARAALLAAAAVTGLGAAADAATATAYQITSPVYWSAGGSYADLVLHYDTRASATLTINQIYALDIFGQGIATALQSCGTPIKTGDTVTSHQLSPGQICWVRVYRTSNAIVGRAVMNDGTGGTSAISQFVRTSLEIRDQNNAVLTHVEAR